MTQTTAEKTTAPAAPLAHFSAPHRVLSDALNLTALSVAPRPLVPILGGIVAESTPDSVTLHAYDYETTVSVTLPAVPASTGRSVLDHGELKKILAGVAAGETKSAADRIPVTVSAEILSTPDIAVPLTTYPTEDFPALPTPAAPVASVDSGAFLSQLTRVLTAAGADATLPVLMCVQFTLHSGSLTMHATDQYRMASADVPVTRSQIGKPHKTVSALIPADILDKVAKQMRRYDGPVGIGVVEEPKIGATLVTLTFDNVQVSFRPYEGSLPKTKSLLPEASHLSITLDRAATIRAAKKAAALAKAKKDGMSCMLDSAEEGTVSLAPFYGEKDRTLVRGVSLPVTLANGTPDALAATAVRVNSKFLLEALSTFTGDGITIHLQAPGDDGRVAKPLLLTDGPALRGEGYWHLLMPLRD
ncbi:putative DNA polymerase III subunit beta (plasmid) [Actinacidiphila reveromycinica]|uniref:Putative DNA polymerase III subunit beta n=1 Tax=Actinacidiphila reveromycinica TaxID=659352 RepID=A0A7U3QW46_9ACTN|nr:DNA polymerase III subunit beta [Streptomyces sp. SN-593]BBG20637.1 putative DNA polymerase III subunit beta [Streptomyces sp. SN-593]